MAAHSNEAMQLVLELRAGAGGGVGIVSDSEPTGGGHFFAGMRQPPVDTLLEAVLRAVLSDKTYDLVAVVTSGRGGTEDLPDLRAGTYPIRRQPLAWSARGALDDALDNVGELAPTEEPAAASFVPSDGALERAMGHVTRGAQSRALATGDMAQVSYYERLDRLSRFIDRIVERGRRSLVVVQGELLFPEPSLLREAIQESCTGLARDVLCRPLGQAFAESKADVLLFSSDPVVPLLAHRDDRAMAAYVRRTIGPVAFEQQRPPVPPMKLVGKEYPRACRVAPWQRVANGCQPHPLLVAGPDATTTATTTYAALRYGRVDPPRSMWRRPIDPSRLCLEFWAEVDVEGLAQHMELEFIGQAAAKRRVLGDLTGFRSKCRRALREPNAGSVGDLLPPLFAFFGAFGMGKTMLAKVMHEKLFGRERSELVSLIKVSVEAEIKGPSHPFLGSDSKSSLIRFLDKTGGLGGFTFDEITRPLLANGQSLTQALEPLYDVTGGGAFRAANADFGLYHLANTLVVLTGNVVPGDEEPPASFHRVDDLGAPLQDRINRGGGPIYFTPLQDGELSDATVRMIEIRVRRQLSPHDLPVVVTPALRQAVATRAKQIAARGGIPLSLRCVGQVADLLRIREAFDARPATDAGPLVLDVGALPDE